MDTAGHASVMIEPPRADGLCWRKRFVTDAGEGTWEWEHYDLVVAQARLTIESDSTMPEAARKLLTGNDLHVHLLVDGETIAGVMPAFAGTGLGETDEIVFWHFAARPDRLVTGRRSPTHMLYNLWQMADGGPAPRCPASLVDLCITHFARDIHERLDAIADDVDEVESLIMDEPDRDRLTNLSARLGRGRRTVARLKRSLTPVVRTLQTSLAARPSWAQSFETETACRTLQETLDDVLALQERTRALNDELSSLYAQETNRRLYLLSIVTTLLMPASFIASYFGMNTGGLPWSGDAAKSGTMLATLLCVLVVLLTLGLLRWRRLL